MQHQIKANEYKRSKQFFFVWTPILNVITNSGVKFNNCAIKMPPAVPMTAMMGFAHTHYN